MCIKNILKSRLNLKCCDVNLFEKSFQSFPFIQADSRNIKTTFHHKWIFIMINNCQASRAARPTSLPPQVGHQPSPPPHKGEPSSPSARKWGKGTWARAPPRKQIFVRSNLRLLPPAPYRLLPSIILLLHIPLTWLSYTLKIRMQIMNHLLKQSPHSPAPRPSSRRPCRQRTWSRRRPYPLQASAAA